MKHLHCYSLRQTGEGAGVVAKYNQSFLCLPFYFYTSLGLPGLWMSFLRLLHNNQILRHEATMQSQIQNEIFHHPVRTEDSVSWWWIRDRFERFWCWMHCGGFCEELCFFSFFFLQKTGLMCVEMVTGLNSPKDSLSDRIVDMEGKVMS